MGHIKVGRGGGFSVGRSKEPFDRALRTGVFMPRPMPDASVVQEMNRDVHEQALKAASRKLRDVLGKK